MKSATAKEYPDNDGNGIPDAFENRTPISEILSEQFYRAPEQERSAPNSYPSAIVEIERYPRPPKEGEWFICGTEIVRARADMDVEAIIVRHVKKEWA